ncbi:hypothetical protein C8R45DRAFT_1011330 [Mycena sanguinolenta]|nr:hypothetical protein C8R45DRAFT_1011330 [Mycena sanguinolenta]
MTSHPALGVENLSRLPPYLQEVATAAISGSTKDLSRLYDLVRDPRAPIFQLDLLLPVFYTLLDPGTIPEPCHLDPDSSDSTRQSSVIGLVARAAASLDALRTLGELPPGVGADLWSRVWRWMLFMHTYREAIPHAPSETRICLNLFHLMNQLLLESEIVELIKTNPRVQFVVARGWMLLFDVNDLSTRIDGCNSLCRFFKAARYAQSVALEEFIEGAGGTLSHLASLIVKHITFFTLNSQTVTSSTPLMLAGVLDFLWVAEYYDQEYKNDHSDPTWDPYRKGPLCMALVSKGIVGALTIAISALNNITNTKAVIEQCFQELTSKLRVPPGHRRMREAVKAGLLPAIVSCAQMHPYMSFGPSYILMDFLPQSTFYPSTLRELESALPQVDDRTATEIFGESWIFFIGLARERLQLLDSFDSGALGSLRACDNMTTCGDILPKHNFMRCSACQRVYYCSKECQLADWREAHRELCTVLRNFSLQPRYFGPPALLTTREKAFLRAILHHDYEANKQHVRIRQAEFIRRNPGHDYWTIFDYTAADHWYGKPHRAGRVRIQVSNTDTMPPQWRPYLSQATRQPARRMELHLMSIDEEMPQMLFPMRSSNSSVHDAIGELATHVEPRTMFDGVLRYLRGEPEFEYEHRVRWEPLKPALIEKIRASVTELAEEVVEIH